MYLFYNVYGFFKFLDIVIFIDIFFSILFCFIYSISVYSYIVESLLIIIFLYV